MAVCETDFIHKYIFFGHQTFENILNCYSFCLPCFVQHRCVFLDLLSIYEKNANHTYIHTKTKTVMVIIFLKITSSATHVRHSTADPILSIMLRSIFVTRRIMACKITPCNSSCLLQVLFLQQSKAHFQMQYRLIVWLKTGIGFSIIRVDPIQFHGHTHTKEKPTREMLEKTVERL